MHTSPDVLVLIALGEEAGTPADRGHVASCATCSREVAELSRITEVGRATTMPETMTTPSPQVWERIRLELGFDAESPVLAAAATPPGAADLAAHRNRRATGSRSTGARRFAALAVAAALALLVGIGVGVGIERQTNSPENRVIASAQLDAQPDWTGSTGRAEVRADGRGGRTLILTMSTAKPVTGPVTVWLMDQDTREPQWMGTMESGKATLVIPPGMSLFTRPMVDVTSESGPDGHTYVDHTILRGQLA